MKFIRFPIYFFSFLLFLHPLFSPPLLGNPFEIEKVSASQIENQENPSQPFEQMDQTLFSSTGQNGKYQEIIQEKLEKEIQFLLNLYSKLAELLLAGVPLSENFLRDLLTPSMTRIFTLNSLKFRWKNGESLKIDHYPLLERLKLAFQEIKAGKKPLPNPPLPQPSMRKGVITAKGGLNFREAPWGRKIALLPFGSEAHYLGKEGEWIKVSVNGKQGFIHGKYFQIQNESPDVSPIPIPPISNPSNPDKWVFLGASITVGAVRKGEELQKLVLEKLGKRVIIKNEAVSGWTSGKLLANLPTILSRNQGVKYFPIHIGGNDVSGKRPYPRGSETLRSNLEKIIRMVKQHGSEPILFRLSFRNYKNVPPEENGSGPYVKNIYDPMIKEFCPRWFNQETQMGRVDFYNFLRDHPAYLSNDGVHLTGTGYKKVREDFLIPTLFKPHYSGELDPIK